MKTIKKTKWILIPITLMIIAIIILLTQNTYGYTNAIAKCKLPNDNYPRTTTQLYQYCEEQAKQENELRIQNKEINDAKPNKTILEKQRNRSNNFKNYKDNYTYEKQSWTPPLLPNIGTTQEQPKKPNVISTKKATFCTKISCGNICYDNQLTKPQVLT